MQVSMGIPDQAGTGMRQIQDTSNHSQRTVTWRSTPSFTRSLMLPDLRTTASRPKSTSLVNLMLNPRPAVLRSRMAAQNLRPMALKVR